MRVDLLSKNTFAPAFSGTKEVLEFRKEARDIIKKLEKIQPGTFEYVAEDAEGGKSLQQRLWNAIFVDPKKLGEEYITKKDRLLHEKLKSLYKEYQEADDFMDAMCGGGGHYVDQTINYYI